MFVFPAPVLTRRVPTSRLLDTLFSDRVATPADRTRVPAMDVTETDTAFTLAFEVPGVTREQLQATVQGRRVVIETTPGEAAAAADGERVLYRERAAARYARTVVLPAEVDAASAAARFDNGVLSLTLSKKVPTGATRIDIA